MATKFWKNMQKFSYFSYVEKYKNLRFIKVTLLMLKKARINVKTYHFETQCKGDISHACETAKITVFDPMVCKTPDAPLQNELLYWTFVQLILLVTFSFIQTVNRRRSSVSGRSSTALEQASYNVTSANSLSAFQQQLERTLFQQSFRDIMWHFLSATLIVVLAVARHLGHSKNWLIDWLIYAALYDS